MRLPIRPRLYFAGRLCGIRTLQGLGWIAGRLNWPWLAFTVMSIQRRMGWRYER